MPKRSHSAVLISLTLLLLSAVWSWNFAECQQDAAGTEHKQPGTSAFPSPPSDSRPEALAGGCKLHAYEGNIPLRKLPNYFAGKQDLRGGMTCRFSINPKLPEFIFHFIGSDDNTFGDIEVREENSSRIIQTIENETDPGLVFPQHIESVLSAVDANFDGYNDLAILSNCGGTGNCAYDFFLYDPSTNQFVPNRFLSDLSSPEFHEEKKRVTTHSHGSAADWERDTYQFEKGRYILIHQEISSWDRDTDVVTVLTYELRDGKMVLVDSSTEHQ